MSLPENKDPKVTEEEADMSEDSITEITEVKDHSEEVIEDHMDIAMKDKTEREGNQDKADNSEKEGNQEN